MALMLHIHWAFVEVQPVKPLAGLEIVDVPKSTCFHGSTKRSQKALRWIQYHRWNAHPNSLVHPVSRLCNCSTYILHRHLNSSSDPCSRRLRPSFSFEVRCHAITNTIYAGLASLKRFVLQPPRESVPLSQGIFNCKGFLGDREF